MTEGPESERRPRPSAQLHRTIGRSWRPWLGCAALAVLVIVHGSAAFSILRQPLGAAPAQAPLRLWFNDGTHRIGPGADFFALYGAGASVRRDTGPYGPIPRDAGVPYAFPYRYSPIVASTLGVAATFARPRTAFVTWACVLEALLLACIVMWWRRTAGGLRWFGIAALLLSTPFVLELQMGQFTFAATAFAFFAALRSDRPHRGSAPAALAVGAFLKTFPLVSVPALLRQRPRVTLAVFAVFAAILAIDVALRTAEWQTLLSLNFGATHLSPHDVGNYGLLHAVAQWGRATGVGFGPTEVDAAAWWVRIAALGLACAVALVRRPNAAGVCIVVAALLIGHFISYQHVWEHHYSGVVLAGLLVAHGAKSSQRSWITLAAVACVLVLAAPTPFYFFDDAHDPRLWDPAAHWELWRVALLPTFKALPALLLYLLALRMGVALTGRARVQPAPGLAPTDTSGAPSRP